ncbi:response regulator transcription factor [Thioalkalivibrio sp. ALE28]|uniref:response regulator transcription factor n=1 Tax=Thioalkalivibrio sp. ALE28 TaxID=1158179 RepID=UPI00036A21FA|nr:response regulator transcription factor [Thioalkalivibrio sp. ALE28]
MTEATIAGSALVRILVVDDELPIIEELVECLESTGHPCCTAQSAEEAREKFLKHPDIGIILTDIKMPQEDGIQFVDWLVRQHDDERVFETAVFTGHGSHEKAVEAMRAGVRDYFQKPLDLEHVTQSVENLRERVLKRRATQRIPGEVENRLESLGSSLSEISENLAVLRSQVGLDTAEQKPAPQSASHLPHVNHSDFDRLTARQKEVVKLVANAYSNYQIAYELGITENTVKLYVSQVLHTLGLTNRTQLALAATREQFSDHHQSHPAQD